LRIVGGYAGIAVKNVLYLWREFILFNLPFYSVIARNSSEAFDLRCYIRENLLKYVNEHVAQSLPQRKYRGIEENAKAKQV